MRQCVVVLVLASLAGGGWAQKGFAVGVQGTGQLSWLLNPDDASTTSLERTEAIFPAWNAGVLVQEHVHRNWAFETGLVFAQLGSNTDYVAIGRDSTGQEVSRDAYRFQQRLSYVQVPLMVQWNSGPEKKLQFFAQLGVQPGILAAVKAFRDDEELPDTLENANRGRDEQFQRFELSALANLGAALRLSNQLRLRVGLRGGASLLDVEDQRLKVGERSASRWFVGGLNVGLMYVLKPAQASKPEVQEIAP